MIAFELAVPVMLASWWSLLISVANVFLIILRTALEDRTLQAELPAMRLCPARALSSAAGNLVNGELVASFALSQKTMRIWWLHRHARGLAHDPR